MDRSRSKLIYNATRAFCVGRVPIYAPYTYVRSAVAIDLPSFGVDRCRSAEIAVEWNPATMPGENAWRESGDASSPLVCPLVAVSIVNAPNSGTPQLADMSASGTEPLSPPPWTDMRQRRQPGAVSQLSQMSITCNNQLTSFSPRLSKPKIKPGKLSLTDVL